MKYNLATYLIDFENVRSDGLRGINWLSEKDTVVIFYSNNADTLTFEAMDLILNSNATIRKFKIARGGKNALDFQLATYLGFLIHENQNPYFYIISRDNGFHYVIDFWKRTYRFEGYVFCCASISEAYSKQKRFDSYTQAEKEAIIEELNQEELEQEDLENEEDTVLPAAESSSMNSSSPSLPEHASMEEPSMQLFPSEKDSMDSSAADSPSVESSSVDSFSMESSYENEKTLTEEVSSTDDFSQNGSSVESSYQETASLKNDPAAAASAHAVPDPSPQPPISKTRGLFGNQDYSEFVSFQQDDEEEAALSEEVNSGQYELPLANIHPAAAPTVPVSETAVCAEPSLEESFLIKNEEAIESAASEQAADSDIAVISESAHAETRNKKGTERNGSKHPKSAARRKPKAEKEKPAEETSRDAKESKSAQDAVSEPAASISRRQTRAKKTADTENGKNSKSTPKPKKPNLGELPDDLLLPLSSPTVQKSILLTGDLCSEKQAQVAASHLIHSSGKQDFYRKMTAYFGQKHGIAVYNSLRSEYTNMRKNES